MRLLHREKLKTATLLILLLCTFVQIGILWNSRFPRYPFSFLKKIFLSPSYTVDLERTKNMYLMPKSIFVNNGKQLYSEITTNNVYYRQIWLDVKNHYLKKIMNSKPEDILGKEEWFQITKIDGVNSGSGIFAQRGIFIEMPFAVDSNIFAWFIPGLETYAPAFAKILKIAIIPDEDINESVNTIYIYDGSQIYKYLIDINLKEGFRKKADYREIIEMQSKSKGRILYQYIVFKVPIPEDMLVSMSQSPQIIHDVIVKKPDDLRYIERIEQMLLTSEPDSKIPERESFIYSKDVINKAIVFSEREHLFRVYNTDVLEYKYLPRQEERNKGNLKQALEKVLLFIEPRFKIINGADVVLTGYKNTRNKYTFYFDYRINNKFILILNKDNKRIPAITIDAGEKRVYDCWWVLKDFVENDNAIPYEVFFKDVYERAIFIYKFPPNKRIESLDIEYVYQLNNEEQEAISPKWVINKDFYFNMKKKDEE